jgi:hypothetical protein
MAPQTGIARAAVKWCFFPEITIFIASKCSCPNSSAHVTEGSGAFNFK